ncbi:trypsin inhibitor 2-like [Neltuma alba]|uniref:trypsin inhibitor 2-like n=1 Tax=Neltuma alba TaxID=207710 RepID=UPI0010A2C0FC|nr:trypsin inhibitor 2-like [Prosopis alba]
MMKLSAFLSFLFFLLLSAFATTISAEAVVDSDGHILRNGGKYYLSPATPIGGGGIIASAIRHGDSNFCSLAVVSALFTNGWAVTISTYLKVTFIKTTYPVNLAFAYLVPNVCTDSPNWVVVNSLPLGQPVMLGGAQEFSAASVPGQFYIKTYDSEKHYYKIVFCEQGKDHCGDIGVKVDSAERRRLVVTDDKNPLVFKFDKVNESSNSDLSMVV